MIYIILVYLNSDPFRIRQMGDRSSHVDVHIFLASLDLLPSSQLALRPAQEEI